MVHYSIIVKILCSFLWLALLPALGAQKGGDGVPPLRSPGPAPGPRLPARPQRIVSLAPSLTETLFALGVGDRVVGVTDFCDYPPEALAKPRVGGMINPNLERILSLHPDLALVTREGNRRETLEALERLSVPAYAVEIERLEDVSRTVRDLGQVVGEPAAGAALAEELDQRVARVHAAVEGYPARRVLFLVWLHPVVSVGRGSFLNDLLEKAGARSIAEATLQPWPHLSLEEILRQDPEIIVVPRSPDFEPTREDLLRLPGWRNLAAVEQNRILYVPSAIERPGPRIAEMLETLARALHPEAFGPIPSSQFQVPSFRTRNLKPGTSNAELGPRNSQ